MYVSIHYIKQWDITWNFLFYFEIHFTSVDMLVLLPILIHTFLLIGDFSSPT